MPIIEVQVDVACSKCGKSLVGHVQPACGYTNRETTINVEPCKKCLDAAEDKGYERGIEDED